MQFLLAALLAQAPITDNDYGVEVHVGPVVGSQRTVGMAGAFVGVAEGADGVSFNPAAFAARRPYSYDWFDYDVAADFYVSGLMGANDFDLDGRRDERSRPLLVTGTGLLQFGGFGVGVNYLWLSHCVDRPGDDASCSVGSIALGADDLFSSLQLLSLGGAYSFARDALLVGASLVAPSYSLNHGGELVRIEPTDSALAVGGVWRPASWPLRIGAMFRSAIGGDAPENLAADADGVVRVDGLVIPSRVHMPWVASLGASYGWGREPYNKAWSNPRQAHAKVRQELAAEREARSQQQRLELDALSGEARKAAKKELKEKERRRREDEDALLKKMNAAGADAAERAYQASDRRFVLLAFDVEVTGPSPQLTTGLEGLIYQLQDPAGTRPTFEPRVGAELEPLPHLLRVRAGTYLEPSRYDLVQPRLHATTGADWHVFDVFGVKLRLSVVADIAAQYLNVGASLGLWH